MTKETSQVPNKQADVRPWNMDVLRAWCEAEGVCWSTGKPGGAWLRPGPQETAILDAV